MSSKFINVNCESCGAELAIPRDEMSMKCGFCGTLNTIKFDDLDSPANPSRTLMLNAVKSENWEEVAKYSTTILEDDPSDYEAWFYKGAAAGWVSKHIDDPSKEIINCFRNAFANSKQEDTEQVLNLLGTEGCELLLALAMGSRGFAQDHGYLNVGDFTMNGWQADVMNGHISKIYGYIDACHVLTEINRNDRVDKLNPSIDAMFLTLYSFIWTKVPFNGTMTSKNPFNLIDATFQHVYDKESEYGLVWEPRVDEILETHANGGYDAESLEADGLSEIDFANPRQEVAADSGGGCFIATAVYGGEGHFNLIVLRSFRDNFLKNYYLGRSFIGFYYKYGPKLAKKVASSKLLKSLFTPLVELGVFIIRLFRIG